METTNKHMKSYKPDYSVAERFAASFKLARGKIEIYLCIFNGTVLSQNGKPSNLVFGSIATRTRLTRNSQKKLVFAVPIDL